MAGTNGVVNGIAPGFPNVSQEICDLRDKLMADAKEQYHRCTAEAIKNYSLAMDKEMAVMAAYHCMGVNPMFAPRFGWNMIDRLGTMTFGNTVTNQPSTSVKSGRGFKWLYIVLAILGAAVILAYLWPRLPPPLPVAIAPVPTPLAQGISGTITVRETMADGSSRVVEGPLAATLFPDGTAKTTDGRTWYQTMDRGWTPR